MRKVWLRSVVASGTGRSHRFDGVPCEDAADRYQDRGVAAVCVCDGAGSAKYARFGATIASAIAVRFVADRFNDLFETPEESKKALIHEILAALEVEAKRLDTDVRQLSSTIAFAAARIRPKSGAYVCGNLGDGIVLMRQSSEVKLLIGRDNGEFGNETSFTTSRNAAEKLQLTQGEVLPSNVPGWLMTTDGAADLMHSKRTGKIAPGVLSILEDARTLKPIPMQRCLQSWVDNELVMKSGDYDDCSVAVLQVSTRSRAVSRRATH